MSDILAVDELSAGLQALLNSSEEEGAKATATTSKVPEGQEGSYDRWTLKDEASIDYGLMAKTGGEGIAEREGWYLTTAINYTNGPAHMGHAYEATTSDILVRFHRLLGQPVYFCTGSDEHGQKIANTAADSNQQPIDICDKFVTGFKVLNQRILISNDEYVRTTSDRHKRNARELWKKCALAGDIYLDKYEGWYNVREETFVTDNDAALSDFKDPTSGVPLKKVEEESYFFRMSKYQHQLIEYIEKNPEFIQPEQHRNFILSRLGSDELRDLSISRTTFSWGIPVPEGFEPNHVMYVWVDALSNYLTGVDAQRIENDKIGLDKFWPANVHVIGKDILWFHTVIWPCLLMSAGLPLPKTVFAHGFVNDKNGKKMSKSLGNVVDPHDMLDKYEVDTFRWYLSKEASFGGELSFNEDNLRDMHNSDLCDTLGNLVHRATNLCGKFCGGIVPDVSMPSKLPIDCGSIMKEYLTEMEQFGLQKGAQVAIAAFRDVNAYLQEEAPWLKKGDEFQADRQTCIRVTLEAIYWISHLLIPFIPTGCRKIFERLNSEPLPLERLSHDLCNLEVGTKINHGDILYAKLKSEDELDKEQQKSSKKESHAEAQARKKAEKAKQIAAAKKGSASTDDADQPDFTKIEIKVGKIVRVWEHPEADKLLCEEIDIGEETVREITSGLRQHYSLEEMEGKHVLVVSNLKPQKIVGFTSNGMVLAAKSPDGTKVELVCPPEGSIVGERVFIDGVAGEPLSSSQVKKKKIWESVAANLKTNEDGIATWEGKALLTAAGPCRAKTLGGVPVS